MTLEYVCCYNCNWCGPVNELEPFDDHNTTSYYCPDCKCPDLEEVEIEEDE